jgi:ParB/RepB/Spo0J family partition protein
MAKKGLDIPEAKPNKSGDVFDLDVLMGKKQVTAAEAVTEVTQDYNLEDGAFVVMQIAASDIVADPDQPRDTKKLTNEYISELGDSIEATGQIYPIIVRKNPNARNPQHWMIVDGECRWLAVGKKNGLNSLNCIVLNDDLDLTDILIMQVTANNKRKEMSAADDARAYARIAAGLKDQGKTQETIATQLGMHRVTLSKYIRLAKEENTVILKLSEDGHTQDLSTLIGLAAINDSSPETAQNVIDLIEAGNVPSDLRGYIDKTLKNLNKDKKPKSAPRPKVYKPSNVSLIESGGISTLSLKVGDKAIQLDLSDIKDELKKLLH